MWILLHLLLLAGPGPVPGAGPGPVPGAGRILFEKRCSGCHALDRDKEGPRLAGVYGRPAASLNAFPYSEALRQSKLTWNAETLDRWLADAEKLVPGTEMAIRLDKAEERRDIIEYLKQISAK
jgi:cytochrome c